MQVNSVAPSTIYNNQYSTEKTKETVTDNEAVTNDIKEINSKLSTTVEEVTKADSSEDTNVGSNINIYA